MWEGRQRSSWRQTAEICATFAEANRNPEQRPTPYTYRDFTPFPDDVPADTDDERDPRTLAQDMRKAWLGW